MCSRKKSQDNHTTQTAGYKNCINKRHKKQNNKTHSNGNSCLHPVVESVLKCTNRHYIVQNVCNFKVHSLWIEPRQLSIVASVSQCVFFSLTPALQRSSALVLERQRKKASLSWAMWPKIKWPIRWVWRHACA